MNTRELTGKARGIASCLSYNDDVHQAAAKHMLLEMAHRLDTLDIGVYKENGGLRLVNGLGKSRHATMKERILFLLFGIIPSVV